MKALIDGDVIVYQAGFASDQRIYHVGTAEFPYKKDAVHYAKTVGFDLKNITKTVVPEPLSYCLHSVKKMIESIVVGAEATDHKIYLTGKGNFRDTLVTDYKANRVASHKPHWHKEIREYLIKTYSAVVCDGVEADDQLGIDQTVDYLAHGGDALDCDSVICTIDKDLKMISGWNYNWNKGELIWVNYKDGLKWFFTQWLTGDTADNIAGLKGVGEKTAEKLLKGIHDPEKLYHKVISEWIRRTDRSFKDIHIIGDLLWIQRAPSDTWSASLGLALQRLQLEESDNEPQEAKA